MYDYFLHRAPVPHAAFVPFSSASSKQWNQWWVALGSCNVLVSHSLSASPLTTFIHFPFPFLNLGKYLFHICYTCFSHIFHISQPRALSIFKAEVFFLAPLPLLCQELCAKCWAQATFQWGGCSRSGCVARLGRCGISELPDASWYSNRNVAHLGTQ